MGELLAISGAVKGQVTTLQNIYALQHVGRQWRHQMIPTSDAQWTQRWSLCDDNTLYAPMFSWVIKTKQQTLTFDSRCIYCTMYASLLVFF